MKPPHPPHRSFSTLLGPVVNALCLVHCLGLALVGLLLPSLGSFLVWKLAPYRVSIEFTLLVVSALAGAYALSQSSTTRRLRPWFYLLVVVGLSACWFQQWTLLHVVFVGMSALQFMLLKSRTKLALGLSAERDTIKE